MKLHTYRKFLFLFFFTLSSFLLCDAQNNPVIDFREGLVIQTSKPVTYTRYGRTEFPFDPIGFGLISGTLSNPKPGGKPEGTEGQWENIKVSEDGYFKSDKFNGGGLYLEYFSPKNQVMILDAAGHDKVYVNGIPREGDHFDTKMMQIPVEIRKGKNSFYLTGGLSNKIKASLYLPKQAVMLTTSFMTKPDLIRDEKGFKWASVMLMNTTNVPVTDLVIQCIVNGKTLETPAVRVEKITSRRIPYQIPEIGDVKADSAEVVVNLLAKSKKVIGSVSYQIKIKSFKNIHERTFVSSIDESVQYYSVIPGSRQTDSSQALIMAVHGAGLEARNLAKVYDPKDWANLVLPTNRGAFGFAWEDWGRLDFLEVYEIGKKLFNPDPQKIYLTGHSMGGHASWYLGATYPDKWAAIGPCAGYPQLHEWIGHVVKDSSGQRQMFVRAGSSQLTKALLRNYLGKGIYINHGDADPTVSVEHAREMRSILGQFHPDFTYYEYPGGNHWYGDLSADWPPLFDFLKLHSIPEATKVRHVEFKTFSPGISASSHWITIHQQLHPYKLSGVDFKINSDSSVITGLTENVKVLALDLAKMSLRYPVSLNLDKQKITFEKSTGKLWLSRKADGNWEQVTTTPDPSQKGPHRNGNFKDAFRHNMVFVYGTNGTQEENSWLYNKARYDAETFGYRGNGSIEIIPDKDFKPENYADRGIIVYGNSLNNNVWKSLLSESPIQVTADKIVVGRKEFTGADLACYFIVPRKDSKIASVGVVSGTGLAGFKATYANAYFQAGTAFPDFTVFRNGAALEGYQKVECAGWFGKDWNVEENEAFWKKN